MKVRTKLLAPMFLIVDLFCGAGGVTTGFENSDHAKVIACVNHDPVAIKSHKLNHKNVLHFVENVKTMNLDRLIKHVAKLRRMYPNAKLIVWASLECTNFSKAKGGLPRNADSRTLADHLDRYILALNPDYVQIENVVEFMSWGPLTARVVKTNEGYPCCNVRFVPLWDTIEESDGSLSTVSIFGRGEQVHVGAYNVLWDATPESKNSGKDWLRWRNEINLLGYYDEWREMNAADYGAYTSRNRLFGCFAKHGLPITWPTATHAKKPRNEGLFGANLQKWKAVKDVLDFSDEGGSIFRQKALSEKTLERIYAGLIKYVAGGKEAFIQKHFSGKPDGKVVDINGPTGAITTSANQSLIQCFLTQHYSNGGELKSIDEPAATLTTKDRISKIWLDKQYGSGKNNHQSADLPAGTLTANPKLNLVSAEGSFVMPTSYNNKPTDLNAPCSTITANRKHHYLVNPSWGGANADTNQPCPVVVARQDKAPLYMVIAQEGKYEQKLMIGRSICDLKIRLFMHHYGIVDIKMRMLKVEELLKIQGFPEGYQLLGTQADKKKFIGNSVVPQVVTAWVNSMAEKLNSILIAA